MSSPALVVAQRDHGHGGAVIHLDESDVHKPLRIFQMRTAGEQVEVMFGLIPRRGTTSNQDLGQIVVLDLMADHER